MFLKIIGSSYIKKITSILVDDKCFVNYVNLNLLKETIGDVCSIQGNTYISSILLAMKADRFFPVKFLIPFIISSSSEKQLLSIFIETLKSRFKLGVNWRILLSKIGRENQLVKLKDLFTSLRFINMCGTQGIKILQEEMIEENGIDPVTLPSDNQHKFFSKNILKLWFQPYNRGSYLASLRQAINIFGEDINTNIDVNIKNTVVAQLLFSIIETYDLQMMLDITEPLTPFYIFKGIPREILRNYVSYILSRLMGTKVNLNDSERYIFAVPQEKLEILIKNMRLEGLNDFLRTEGIYFEKRR